MWQSLEILVHYENVIHCLIANRSRKVLYHHVMISSSVQNKITTLNYLTTSTIASVNIERYRIKKLSELYYNSSFYLKISQHCSNPSPGSTQATVPSNAYHAAARSTRARTCARTGQSTAKCRRTTASSATLTTRPLRVWSDIWMNRPGMRWRVWIRKYSVNFICKFYPTDTTNGVLIFQSA